MKVKELIEKLEEFDGEQEVEVFAAGDIYKVEQIKTWTDKGETVVELGCGWNKIEEK